MKSPRGPAKAVRSRRVAWSVGMLAPLVFFSSCSGNESPTNNASYAGNGGAFGDDGAGGDEGGLGGSSAGASAEVAGSAGSVAGDSGAGGSYLNAGSGGEATGGAVDGCAARRDRKSVLERGNNPARTAHFVQPALSTTAVSRAFAADAEFQANFPGHVLAVPLYLAPRGCEERGMFFAVTLENDIFALDEETGAIVWSRNVGPPAGPGAGPGVVSRGIMSTPVIDDAARVLYLVAGIGPGALIRHEIHAISVDTGLELPGNWPIDVSKVRSGNFTFNPARQHQRSALSLVSGRLYVAFGGNGDSAGYRGWVVIVNTEAPSDVTAWTSLGAGEGIWDPGGMASDGNGVFAITGNGTSTSDDHADTDAESVLRIPASGVSVHDAANQFVPSEWKSMDAGDLDFGSCSPLLVHVPGSSPEHLLVAPSKPGQLYLLDPNHLGGVGGQLSTLIVGNPNAESVYAVPTTYETSQGVYVTLNVSAGAPCPTGLSNYNLLSVLLKPGSPPVPQVAWCAKLADDNEVGRRSPISTTTDGRSNAIVWFMNGSSLNAFEGDGGTPLFVDAGPGCSGVHRFTSPIASNGRIIVGGDGHLCAWSVHQ